MGTAFASFLAFLRVAWPIISMIAGALLSSHAAASHAAAKDGSVGISEQAVHVAGAGVLGGLALVAGAAGVVSNHKAAASAPSKPPEGVAEVLHREDELHSAMISDPATTPAELNALNALIIMRKPGAKPGAATVTARELA